MAQDKAKAQKGFAQKHLHSRISYLYQAATYLATVADQTRAKDSCVNDDVKSQREPIGDLQCGVAATEAVSDKSDTSRLISPTEQERTTKTDSDDEIVCKDSALSRRLVVHLRAVSLRSQIRLSPTMKHTMCKRCSNLLIPFSTSISHMENNSRGARKPWADVLVKTCTACGTAKRFPVGAKRQLRRESRVGKARDMGKHGHHAV